MSRLQVAGRALFLAAIAALLMGHGFGGGGGDDSGDPCDELPASSATGMVTGDCFDGLISAQSSDGSCDMTVTISGMTLCGQRSSADLTTDNLTFGACDGDDPYYGCAVENAGTSIRCWDADLTTVCSSGLEWQ